jgi:hypothetical protein
MQQHTQIEWKPNRDSATLNRIYSLLVWKEGPGTVEVTQDRRKITAATHQLFNHMFDQFLLKSFTSGPVALFQYMNHLMAMRAEALQSIENTLQSAVSINNEIAGEARIAVRNLAAVKLHCAIALAGYACGIVLTGCSVALIADVTALKLANDYVSLAPGLILSPGQTSSNVGAIGYQLKKTALDLGVNRRLDHNREMGEGALKEIEKAIEPKIKLAEQRVEQCCASLASKIRGSKRFNRSNNQLDEALAGMGKLKHDAEQQGKNVEKAVTAARHAGMAASVVFAAWDVMDALNTYQSDVASAN